MPFIKIEDRLVNTDNIIYVARISKDSCRLFLRDSHSLTTKNLSDTEVEKILLSSN